MGEQVAQATLNVEDAYKLENSIDSGSTSPLGAEEPFVVDESSFDFDTDRERVLLKTEAFKYAAQECEFMAEFGEEVIPSTFIEVPGEADDWTSSSYESFCRKCSAISHCLPFCSTTGLIRREGAIDALRDLYYSDGQGCACNLECIWLAFGTEHVLP